MKLLLIVFAVFFVSCSNTYYIVRHAEKADPVPNGSTDVPLTEEGKKRANQVADILKDKKITEVFSTNTLRTKSTAQPTAEHFGLTVQTYGPRPDSIFIQQLRSKKKNILIVGHSNTVDDLVNLLCGKKEVPGDLPETEFNKFYIIKKKGKKYLFTESSIYP